jgi:hypothetical protein
VTGTSKDPLEGEVWCPGCPSRGPDAAVQVPVTLSTKKPIATDLWARHSTGSPEVVRQAHHRRRCYRPATCAYLVAASSIRRTWSLSGLAAGNLERASIPSILLQAESSPVGGYPGLRDALLPS